MQAQPLNLDRIEQYQELSQSLVRSGQSYSESVSQYIGLMRRIRSENSNVLLNHPHLAKQIDHITVEADLVIDHLTLFQDRTSSLLHQMMKVLDRRDSLRDQYETDRDMTYSDYSADAKQVEEIIRNQWKEVLEAAKPLEANFSLLKKSVEFFLSGIRESDIYEDSIKNRIAEKLMVAVESIGELPKTLSRRTLIETYYLKSNESMRETARHLGFDGRDLKDTKERARNRVFISRWQGQVYEQDFKRQLEKKEDDQDFQLIKSPSKTRLGDTAADLVWRIKRTTAADLVWRIKHATESVELIVIGELFPSMDTPGRRNSNMKFKLETLLGTATKLTDVAEAAITGMEEGLAEQTGESQEQSPGILIALFIPRKGIALLSLQDLSNLLGSYANSYAKANIKSENGNLSESIDGILDSFIELTEKEDISLISYRQSDVSNA